MVRVEHAIDSCKAVRQNTAAAVEHVPEADFDFRPAPGVTTFREAARRIADAGGPPLAAARHRLTKLSAR